MKIKMSLLQHTYRCLLRVAKELDKEKWCYSLFLALPKEVYVRRPEGSSVVVELTKRERTSTQDKFDDLVFEFNGKSEMYKPSSKTLTEYVRQHFRGDIVHVDLALWALRYLNIVNKICKTTKPHSKTTTETTSSVPMTNSIEPGSILVSHPAACLSQPTLNRSIVLLTDVDKQSVGGVIVNKAVISPEGSPVKVRDVLLDMPKSQNDLEPLLDNVVFRGGDVMTTSLICLSPVSIEGSSKVRSGVYVCNDIVAAAAACTRGELLSSELKVLAGHCGWAPTQLDLELNRTVWFLAESEDTLSFDQNVSETSEMWSSVVRGFGKDYEYLAQFDGDAVLNLEEGRELIENHYMSLEAALFRSEDGDGAFHDEE